MLLITISTGKGKKSTLRRATPHGQQLLNVVHKVYKFMMLKALIQENLDERESKESSTRVEKTHRFCVQNYSYSQCERT
jgi:hypothetical protein